MAVLRCASASFPEVEISSYHKNISSIKNHMSACFSKTNNLWYVFRHVPQPACLLLVFFLFLCFCCCCHRRAPQTQPTHLWPHPQHMTRAQKHFAWNQGFQVNGWKVTERRRRHSELCKSVLCITKLFQTKLIKKCHLRFFTLYTPNIIYFKFSK